MKIIVIGAGASGLTAAIAAAEQGAKILMLECASKPGKKIYATGNGKCNLTNRNLSAANYRSADLALIGHTLERFGSRQTMEFFENLGMFFKDKNGYVYPSTGQASTVAEVLVKRCRELGVEISCDSKVTSVRKTKSRFSVFYEKEEKQLEEQADIVILAAGSRAGGFGCEVTGTKLAKFCGHRIIPEVPALTALHGNATKFFKLVSGVRVDGTIFLREEGKKGILSQDTGELQLTSYGISGIPAFQVSRYASYGLKRGAKLNAVLDFLPEYTYHMLWDKIETERTCHGNRTLEDIFAAIYHRKLVCGILKTAGVDGSRKIKSTSPEERKRVLQFCKQMVIPLTGTNDLSASQVCAGGVDTGEVTLEFQSKKIENLYIIGETLDVDGICGGYNLQFAWASGWIAGQDAGRKERK